MRSKAARAGEARRAEESRQRAEQAARDADAKREAERRQADEHAATLRAYFATLTEAQRETWRTVVRQDRFKPPASLIDHFAAEKAWKDNQRMKESIA